MLNYMTLYWLPYIIAIAIVVTCVFFMWKSLFADRSKGRRRCPKCWYDMAYSEGLTCSECGHVARRESDFARTNRDYARATLALFLCVFTILGAYWKLTERGFIASMPSGVLITAFPLISDASSEVMVVMARRMLMDQVDDAQLERIIARCAGGDWTTSPPDDDWIAKYGAFLIPLRNQMLARRSGSDFHELETPLLDIPARIFLETSSTWPKASRARIRVRTAEWWPVGHEIKLTISNADDPEDTRTIVQRPNRGGARAYVLYSPLLEETTTELNYDIEVFRRRTPIAGDETENEWESLSVDRHTLPITVTESFETAMLPVQSESMTEAMKLVFGRVSRWDGGPQPVRFNLIYNNTFTEEFEGVSMGVTVELLHDGEVARQLDLWWVGGTQNRRRRFGHEVPFEDVETLLSIATEDLADHWKMRVRSNPALAIRAGDNDKYWKGEFTVDLLGLQINDRDVPPKPPGIWEELENGEAPPEEGSELSR